MLFFLKRSCCNTIFCGFLLIQLLISDWRNRRLAFRQNLNFSTLFIQFWVTFHVGAIIIFSHLIRPLGNTLLRRFTIIFILPDIFLRCRFLVYDLRLIFIFLLINRFTMLVSGLVHIRVIILSELLTNIIPSKPFILCIAFFPDWKIIFRFLRFFKLPKWILRRFG